MYVAYKEMGQYLKTLQPFKGNSVTATNQKGIYTVLSYDTVILVARSADDVLYYDSRKYSNTTSRLQNILKRVFNTDNAEIKR